MRPSGLATFIGLIALLAGCATSKLESRMSPGKRDINAVLAAHNEELMAIPGVVGVYVGLLDDAVTPCLKVMLTQDDPTLRQTLPETLEGYRVVPEVTGEIRPLGQR